MSSYTKPHTFSVLTILYLVSAVVGQDFQCPERTGFFPDPIQCDLYYKCSKGDAEEKLCPDGLVFVDKSPNHERCDIPANVDCGDRTELQEPQPSKGCPRANGYFRHSDELACDKFYNCVDGVPHELPCPPGLIYDDTASTCAWPQESKRKDCFKSRRDALEDGFVCPEGEVLGPNGAKIPHPTFPHPDDCQKFYICRNGVQPQKGSCSGDYVYNDETMKCDEASNVPGCEDYFKDKKD